MTVLDCFRDVTKLDLFSDPGWEGTEPALTLIQKDVPFRKALDLLCAAAGVDYDVRYGVLLIAPATRLWSAREGFRTTPLTDAERKSAREWVGELGSDSPKGRDEAATRLRRLGSEARPFLEVAARGSDVEA